MTPTGRRDKIATQMRRTNRSSLANYALAILFAASLPMRAQSVQTDAVRGWEFAASVNLAPQDVKAEATIFIPEKVNRVRALLVVIEYGLGFQMAASPQMASTAEALDGAVLGVQFSNVTPKVINKGLRATNPDAVSDALASLLPRLADETGHQELLDAPLLFWGQSAGGGAAEGFVKRFSDRILAEVLYHSGGGAGEPAKASLQIPTLIVQGGKDTATENLPRDFWSRGRSAGAPWTFAVEPGAAHGDLSDKVTDFMATWIQAVVLERLPTAGTTLRLVGDSSAWMGNNETGDVAPSDNFVGSKTEASWLPDEATARAWQSVVGAAPR